MTRLDQVRVLLVDDHPVIREGVRRELETVPRLKLVGAAGDFQEATKQLDATNPHVAVIDIDLGKKGAGAGLMLARAMRKRHPDTHALIFSTYDDEDLVAEAMAAGVRGYVLKLCPLNELMTAIKRVADGETYYSAGVKPVPIAKDRPTLRELEVLDLVALGNSSQQIAEQLGIERRTVESHRGNLMGKLHAKNSADLIDIAYRLGWLSRRRHKRDDESDE